MARHASEAAANPFESMLRALAIEAGLDVRPQLPVLIGGTSRFADLGDRGRALLVEAESFEHHGSKSGFRRDTRRYTEFVVLGWTVLRFTWDDVVLMPEFVMWALRCWRLRHDEGITLVPDPPPALPHLA